jgi:hypothetical protein
LPLDVWGKVSASRTNRDTLEVEIVDAAERSVRVECLDPNRCVADFQLGETVYFFGLEATEPTIHHGARVQPRNFHELPPDGGLVYKRARALQLYRG